MHHAHVMGIIAPAPQLAREGGGGVGACNLEQTPQPYSYRLCVVVVCNLNLVNLTTFDNYYFDLFSRIA